MAHLPDVAIVTMASVIAISLSIVQQFGLAAVVLLPLLAFLGGVWFKEKRQSKPGSPGK